MQLSVWKPLAQVPRADPAQRLGSVKVIGQTAAVLTGQLRSWGSGLPSGDIPGRHLVAYFHLNLTGQNSSSFQLLQSIHLIPTPDISKACPRMSPGASFSAVITGFYNSSKEQSTTLRCQSPMRTFHLQHDSLWHILSLHLLPQLQPLLPIFFAGDNHHHFSREGLKEKQLPPLARVVDVTLRTEEHKATAALSLGLLGSCCPGGRSWGTIFQALRLA